LSPAEEIYQNKLESQSWKRLIEQQVQRQIEGKKPPCQDNCSWKAYWTGWYSFLRNPGNTGLPWHGSEFKTQDDMIRHIKSRLKAHHLPAYE